MKCTQCGTELKASSRFCPNCGKAVDESDTLARPDVNQQVETGQVDREPESHRISESSQFNQPVYVENSAEADETEASDTSITGQENIDSANEVNQNITSQMSSHMRSNEYDGSYSNDFRVDGYPPNWVGSLPLIDNYIMCYTKKYLDLSGRATRGEFWKFVLVQFVVCFFVSVLLLMLTDFGYWTYTIINLILLLPSVSVQVRRLHDTGRHALWYLLTFIPFGGIVLFIFNLQKSDSYTNKYGPLPDYSHYEG